MNSACIGNKDVCNRRDFIEMTAKRLCILIHSNSASEVEITEVLNIWSTYFRQVV